MTDTSPIKESLEERNDKKVLAGSPCGKTPVCDHFYDCLYGLTLPAGSYAQRAKGGSVSQNLNTLVELARINKFDYLFIVEDDSMFHPNTVLNLLSHNKDVVSGLCLQRDPPFRPYMYEGFDIKTGLGWRKLKDDDEGLIKVTGTGMGGILIKMSVFDKLTKPYFYTKFDGETEWGQDILFGKALMDAGIEVFIDLNVPIWHATQCSVAASKENGKWHTIVKVQNEHIKIG